MSESDSTIPSGYRVIPGFERYCISMNGDVLSSCKRTWDTAVRIKPLVVKDGYLAVNLCDAGGKPKQFKIHTLVLTVYKSAAPEGLLCRHLDGNNQNNHVSNLAWGTPLENMHDRKRHGTSMEGSKNPAAKLNEKDIPEIKRRLANGEFIRVIAADYNVSLYPIWAIKSGLKWKHT